MATIKVLPASLLYSLAVFSSQRSLHPLYGSVPTGLYTLPIICTSTVLGILIPSQSLPAASLFSSIWLFLSPRLAYHVGTSTSARMNNPVWGPAVTNVVLLAPLLLASSVIVRHFTNPGTERISVFTTHVFVILSASRYWANSSRFFFIDDDKILLALGVIALIVWNLTTTFTRRVSPAPSQKGAKSKKPPTPAKQTLNYSKIITLAAVVTLAVLSRLYPATLHPLHTPFTHPTSPVRVLSSVQSLTGVIVVGETLPLDKSAPGWSETYNTIQEMRYLRASHSLLGGVWIGRRTASIDSVTPVSTDSNGTRLGDSVYSTFVLQEAVRLVKGRSPKTALTIGLGAGISTQAFQKHGITTTIVEIDPAVYNAARQYFGLADPGPGRVFLEDARGWAAHRSAKLASAENPMELTFDIIVHDCFSGGGVPQHIFTLEFWKDLKTLLNVDGVLAVNFAGPPASDSARSILTTLETVYGQCRAFHDYPHELTEEQMSTEFINIVFFCSHSTQPLEFRKPAEGDYLNSHLRQYVLSGLPGRELDTNIIHQGNATSPAEERTKWILTDAHNPLGAWQDQGAMNHWKVMKSVFPDAIWEVY